MKKKKLSTACALFLGFAALGGLRLEMARSQTPKEYDLLIRNAVIYDGESLKPTRGDVAVEGGMIAAVGNLKDVRARQEINASGLILSPGFIDAHTHSDFNPILYPGLGNKVTQGVTTEVTGNCGMSAAPVLGEHAKRIRGVWAREGVQVPERLPWRTFGQYRQKLEKAGLSTNLVALVGHGNLRSAVIGFVPRKATQGEVEEMKKLLTQAMKEGARGLSFGLVYVPGLFADEAELTELCRQSARHAGLCAFHIRSEGSKLEEAITEAVRIGEKAQAPVQIAHLKAMGKANWDKIAKAFKVIEDARLRGVRVEADAYPYTASYAELGVLLPDGLYEREDRVEYFRNPANREKILEQLRAHFEARNMKWENILIAATEDKRWKKFEGKTLRDIARERDEEPEQLLLRMLADTAFEISAFNFAQDEEVLEKVLRRSYVSIGSDSIADGSRKPHPRAYGTFPLVLKKYVREEKKIPLGEAIRKMTSQPARHFRLQDRGRILPGYAADLVLFDAGEVRDMATYGLPTLAPRGIKWVFVNGQAAVQNGKPTNVKAGRVL